MLKANRKQGKEPKCFACAGWFCDVMMVFALAMALLFPAVILFIPLVFLLLSFLSAWDFAGEHFPGFLFRLRTVCRIE